MARTANITPGAAPGGIPITLVGGTRLDLLGPIEAPIYELQTRLDFLADFFVDQDAYGCMGHGMLHLLLADCRALADEACKAHEAAWVMTGGTAP